MHSVKATKRSFTLTTVTLLTLTFAGCGIMQRNPRAQNVEPAAGEAKPGNYSQGDGTQAVYGGAIAAVEQVLQGKNSPSSQEQLYLERASFDRAKALYDVSKFPEAAAGFQSFIRDYPAARRTEDAYRLLGVSLYRAGRPADAAPHLKRAAENATSSQAQAEALLTLGECQGAAGNWDEALASTFQIIPDAQLAARLALSPAESNRRKQRVSAPLEFQVKAYMLRAQALAALGKPRESDEALGRGKRLLLDASGFGINKAMARQLSAELGYRELGLLDTRCGPRLSFEKTTEETVLGALDGFYSCIALAPTLLCDTAHGSGAPLLEGAKARYRNLALKPLSLKDHLPPPGRSFREPSMADHFESEIKQLIDAQVTLRADSLRNVEECGLSAIF